VGLVVGVAVLVAVAVGLVVGVAVLVAVAVGVADGTADGVAALVAVAVGVSVAVDTVVGVSVCGSSRTAASVGATSERGKQPDVRTRIAGIAHANRADTNLCRFILASAPNQLSSARIRGDTLVVKTAL
jgi:hypothetical protein